MAGVNFYINPDSRTGALGEFDACIENLKTYVYQADSAVTEIVTGLKGEGIVRYATKYDECRQDVTLYVNQLISLSSELEKQKQDVVNRDASIVS